MDMLKNAMRGDNEGENKPSTQPNAQSEGGGGGGGGFLGGISSKLNSAAGGGKESEKNEDLLDKGVDAVQQYGLGQGPQDNESALEQAKDEQISDEVRRQFKQRTGEDIPIADRPTTFG